MFDPSSLWFRLVKFVANSSTRRTIEILRSAGSLGLLVNFGPHGELQRERIVRNPSRWPYGFPFVRFVKIRG